MNVMEVQEEAVRDRLRREDPEFMKWELEHQRLKDTLKLLDSHPYLTPEEEVERKRIQKLKLLIKDRLMNMIRHYKPGEA